MERIESAHSLLETTLLMLGAKQHIPEFKKNNIDSTILPLLTDNDLQVLGIADSELRSTFIRHCAHLPLLADIRSDLAVDDKYIMKVIHDIDNHLLLLNASMSYALLCNNTKRSDIQLGNATECLVQCAESLTKEMSSLHQTLVPVVKKKTNKWKYGILLLISSTASLFLLKRLLC